jgi:hypothetical protein
MITVENEIKRLVFNNILIVDELFKANGKIYDACLSLQNENKYAHTERINGMQFTRYLGNKASDNYNFTVYIDSLMFSIELDLIVFKYGELSIRVDFKVGPDEDTPDIRLEKIKTFKALFLSLINIKADQTFENIDQFVDLYNMVHI